MTIEERIDFLQQAIDKTREAYEAVEIVDVQDAYSCATYHIKRALEMLSESKAECKREIFMAKVRKLQHERLCKELGIEPFDEEDE